MSEPCAQPATKLPAFSTYALSLCFDKPSCERIRALVSELAQATGNDYLIKNDAPAHLTLGMFHVADENVPALRSAAADFAKEIGRSFSLSFGGTDSFLDKVIFLSLKKDSASFLRLKELNAALHQTLLPQFEPGGNRNYLPESFFPHVALAVKLTREQFERGMIWAHPPASGGRAIRRSALSALHSSAQAVSPQDAPKPPVLPNASGAATIPCAFLEEAKIVAVSLAKTHPYTEIFRASLSSDTLSLEQRHKNMAAIKSTGGKLEVTLRSQLFRFGFRFRKNDRHLAGSPDIVFPHYRAVIFVNGCFWHAHGWSPTSRSSITSSHAHGAEATYAHGWKCRGSLIDSPFLEEPVLYSSRCDKFRMPTTNPEFWLTKFTRNRARDIRDIEKLLEEGWRVGIVWECAITGKKRAQKIRSVSERISLWLEEGLSEPFREF